MSTPLTLPLTRSNWVKNQINASKLSVSSPCHHTVSAYFENANKKSSYFLVLFYIFSIIELQLQKIKKLHCLECWCGKVGGCLVTVFMCSLLFCPDISNPIFWKYPKVPCLLNYEYHTGRHVFNLIQIDFSWIWIFHWFSSSFSNTRICNWNCCSQLIVVRSCHSINTISFHEFLDSLQSS